MIFNGIGVMSGTSLDGLDFAWCQFEQKEHNWEYQILKADTIPYPEGIRKQLVHAFDLSALDYCRLDITLGLFIAEKLNAFIGTSDKPQFIASHGHTIFHQPQIGLTTQIGNGATIAAQTGITTICDFRSVDVALQGQGAPLVPIGDKLLFGHYDACLNLGGFSNISFDQAGKRVAYDISPCNMALNHIANLQNLSYDKDGTMAQNGQPINSMLEALNELSFYHQEGPKSLGKEWFDTQFLPIIVKYTAAHRLQDCQRTLVEHITSQIAASLPATATNLLVTGGGAHNKFLIKTLQDKCSQKIIVPDSLTIDYKEALIFAFLGVLRIQRKNNCLKDVTGAVRNNIGGCIYQSTIL